MLGRRNRFGWRLLLMVLILVLLRWYSLLFLTLRYRHIWRRPRVLLLILWFVGFVGRLRVRWRLFLGRLLRVLILRVGSRSCRLDRWLPLIGRFGRRSCCPRVLRRVLLRLRRRRVVWLLLCRRRMRFARLGWMVLIVRRVPLGWRWLPRVIILV